MLAMPFVHAVIVTTTIVGEVVRVADGDTITVLTDDKSEVRVRLAEIDAPEKSQAYGQRAKQALAQLVFGKQVRVVAQSQDRYGRLIGRIYIGDIDVITEQVRLGMAWVYNRYSHDPALPLLEQEAREAHVGLWSDPFPVPPWQFRSERRGHAAPESTPPEDEDSATFECGTKRYCRQMTSCQEARLYLSTCGMDSLDGDGDGVPCEALCR